MKVIGYKNFLKSYEDLSKKNYELNRLSYELNQFIPENRDEIPIELIYEKLAFDLTPQLKEILSSGAFFKSRYGKCDEIIPETLHIRTVNSKVLEYWYERSKQDINPLLKIHYLSLVIDFSQSVMGNKAKYTNILDFVEAVDRAVEGKYFASYIEGLYRLKNSFDVLLIYNNLELAKKVAEKLIKLEKSTSTDLQPGTWGIAFQMLRSSQKPALRNLFQEATYEIEVRFKRMMLIRKEAHFQLDCLLKALETLSTVYTKEKDIEKLNLMFDEYYQAIQDCSITSSVFVKINRLEKFRRLCLNKGLSDLEKVVLKEIVELGSLTIQKFSKISSNNRIDKEKLDEIIEVFSSGSIKQKFQRLNAIVQPVSYYENQLIEDQNFFFKRFMGVTQLDINGRKVSNIEPLNEINRSEHLISIATQFYTLSAPNLHLAFMGAFFQGNVTTQDVVLEVTSNSIFGNDRKLIIELGVGYYFDHNYIAFITLLVPQIEFGIRQLIASTGASIIKINPDDTQDIKTLGTLLTMEEGKDFFGPDNIFYFRTVLTEKGGLNIRNQVCHGYLLSHQFSKLFADRIMHILIILSSYKLHPSK